MQKWNKRTVVRLISLTAAACVALTAGCIINAVKAKRYRTELELTRQRSLMLLTESLDCITTALLKSEYTASGATMQTLSSEMMKNASQAKSVLSAIDCADTQTDGIYKFLSQVGDYTASVAKKDYDALKSSDGLQSLSRFSKQLSDSVEKLCEKYYDGQISFEKTVSTLSEEDSAAALFSDELTDVEQSFTDYPVLIYDGPFSDANESKSPAALKNERLLSAQEAQKTASRLLAQEGTRITRESDEDGKIPLYCFSAGNKTVGVTKHGGKLCYMICSGYAGQATIDEQEALRRGQEYLTSLGYTGMKSTYYSVYDGVCTVNYAYEKNGVLYYPDLIKVAVSLDTGKVCELDARGYLMNHTKRKAQKAALSKQNARKRLRDGLRCGEGRTVVIPKNSSEVLCYEFLCTDAENRDALVYINAETGQEEQILLLLYSDAGTFTK